MRHQKFFTYILEAIWFINIFQIIKREAIGGPACLNELMDNNEWKNVQKVKRSKVWGLGLKGANASWAREIVFPSPKSSNLMLDEI